MSTHVRSTLIPLQNVVPCIKYSQANALSDDAAQKSLTTQMTSSLPLKKLREGSLKKNAAVSIYLKGSFSVLWLSYEL